MDDDISMKVAAQATPELIQLLDTLFPNQCPALGCSVDDVWFLAGQASVVTYIRNAVEQAELLHIPE